MSDDWRDNPKIQAAQAFAKANNASHAIIFWRDKTSGDVGYASYGCGGKECKEAQLVADGVMSHVEWQFIRRAGKRH
jgi:hypothetical protein